MSRGGMIVSKPSSAASLDTLPMELKHHIIDRLASILACRKSGQEYWFFGDAGRNLAQTNKEWLSIVLGRSGIPKSLLSDGTHILINPSRFFFSSDLAAVRMQASELRTEGSAQIVLQICRQYQAFTQSSNNRISQLAIPVIRSKSHPYLEQLGTTLSLCVTWLGPGLSKFASDNALPAPSSLLPRLTSIVILGPRDDDDWQFHDKSEAFGDGDEGRESHAHSDAHGNGSEGRSQADREEPVMPPEEELSKLVTQFCILLNRGRDDPLIQVKSGFDSSIEPDV